MKNAQRTKSVLVMAPRAITNNTTVTANIDTVGLGRNSDAKGEHLELDIAFASEVNTNAVNPTIALKESDDTNTANFATVNANISTDLTAAGIVRYLVPLAGRKRYLRMEISVATATNDHVVSSATAKIKANQEPARTNEMVDSGGTVVLVS